MAFHLPSTTPSPRVYTLLLPYSVFMCTGLSDLRVCANCVVESKSHLRREREWRSAFGTESVGGSIGALVQERDSQIRWNMHNQVSWPNMMQIEWLFASELQGGFSRFNYRAFVGPCILGWHIEWTSQASRLAESVWVSPSLGVMMTCIGGNMNMRRGTVP